MLNWVPIVVGFIAILIVAIVASAVWTPVLPLIETLTVAESERSGTLEPRPRRARAMVGIPTKWVALLPRVRWWAALTIPLPRT